MGRGFRPFTFFQVLPRSSDRKMPPSLCSTVAKTTLGFFR
jgi:hypothetical protein